MNVTMSEIAERAGCSQATVSKALRNAPDVSAAKRKAVQDIALEMGYRPNPLVSALMASRVSKKGGTMPGGLALISNWPSATEREGCDWRVRPNIIEQLEGIYDQAHKSGFFLEEFSLAPGDLTASRLHQVLSARRVHGIIVLPALDYSELLQLPLEHYCIAVIGARDPIRHLPHTTTNRFDNMIMSLDQLEARGYRRPGLVLGKITERMTNFQYHGAYMSYTDVSCRMSRLPVHILDSLAPQKCMVEWIHKKKPDVVIGNIEVLMLMKTAGFQVPEDIAFSVIDWNPSNTGVAGFDSNQRAVGREVVNLVAGRIYRNSTGVSGHTQSVLIDGLWVDGLTAPVKEKAFARDV